ncbi:MAG: hypothetical protein AB8B61_06045 [Cyclobacteriaceae bacterium]
MRQIFFYLLLTIFFIIVSTPTYSQGCSDAGFCTMGAMQPDQVYSKKKRIKLRSIGFSQYRGTTTLSPVIWVSTVDATFAVKRKNSFQLKLPFQAVKGTLGSNAGIGDLSLSLTRNLINTKKFSINGSIGTKIPTNNGNSEIDGAPAHAYYQTSLGTNDLIVGASLISKKWLFAVGYQQALTRNESQFTWGQTFAVSDADSSYIEKYELGRNLKRGIDVMLRVERSFRYSNFNFFVAALPIVRITKDKITTKEGNRSKLDGTTGMALSALIGGTYHFNTNSSVKFVYGHKITDREVNPDGLTRDNVMSLSYYYNF